MGTDVTPRLWVLVLVGLAQFFGWRKALDDEPGLLYVGMVLFTLGLGFLALCYVGSVLIEGKW